MIVEVNQANFENEVLDSSQPVIVEFWVGWSRPSKMMTPLLHEIAAENAGRVKIARVNVDENHALAERHHIETIPTLIYYTRGLVRDYLVGVHGRREIMSRLEALSFVA